MNYIQNKSQKLRNIIMHFDDDSEGMGKWLECPTPLFPGVAARVGLFKVNDCSGEIAV